MYHTLTRRTKLRIVDTWRSLLYTQFNVSTTKFSPLMVQRGGVPTACEGNTLKPCSRKAGAIETAKLRF